MPSAKGVRQTRRKEKQKKTKVGFSATRVVLTVNDGRTYQALTKKEQLEAQRETARMRSDMRVSISTEATRDLALNTLFDRFVG